MRSTKRPGNVSGELRRRHAQKAFAMQALGFCREYLQQGAKTREDSLWRSRSNCDTGCANAAVKQQLNDQSTQCMTNQNGWRWQVRYLVRMEIHQTLQRR